MTEPGVRLHFHGRRKGRRLRPGQQRSHAASCCRGSRSTLPASGELDLARLFPARADERLARDRLRRRASISPGRPSIIPRSASSAAKCSRTGSRRLLAPSQPSAGSTICASFPMTRGCCWTRLPAALDRPRLRAVSRSLAEAAPCQAALRRSRESRSPWRGCCGRVPSCAWPPTIRDYSRWMLERDDRPPGLRVAGAPVRRLARAAGGLAGRRATRKRRWPRAAGRPISAFRRRVQEIDHDYPLPRRANVRYICRAIS